jgi:gliding motility-associated-like protein
LNDTLIIKHFCGCELLIPNAFTPNNDGINDLFDVKIDSQCQLKKYELTIYNRWGSEIFNSNDISAKWNGDFKNKLVQNGPYIYSIRYQIYGDERKRIFGEVLLVN